jgi:hypothetical protein
MVEQEIGHPVVKAFSDIYIYAKHLNDLGSRKVRRIVLRCRSLADNPKAKESYCAWSTN